MDQLLLDGTPEKTPKQRRMDQAKLLYAAYPLKKSPRRAIPAARRALDRAPFVVIMAGVKRYYDSVIHKKGTSDEHWIKHPEGWFNGDRWEDDDDGPTATPTSSRVAAPEGKYDDLQTRRG